MLLNNILIITTLVSLSIIVISNNWRYRVAGLAVIYLINFVLILQLWPMALASVKLIAGWMGIALLSASQINESDSVLKEMSNSLKIFRLLIISLIWIVLIAITPAINDWIPIPYTQLYIGLSMVTSGLIFSSVSISRTEIFIGVQIFLAGFDGIYSSVEGSALVTGIYALIIISIYLLNSYFSSSTEKVTK